MPLSQIVAASLDSAQNGSAPIYGARAWVNFNGTGTVAIRASGNVSSITDNGTGDYTVNFTTAMSDANYAAQCTTQYDQANTIATAAVFGSYARFAPTASACRVSSQNSATTFDVILFAVAIFR
jgi:hypothetical protein